ncbi:MULTISPECIES: helix-turn-helix domain-containing protein [Enterobacteriaceae]|jgi:transcriptional regulator with XRE-family HTH domain|uniref:Helix-turn-helix domain-containing protein n=2 Tax=Enterobacteriaceae TaxID=543 RepID=A0ABW1PVN5_9ENTR|nr:MULTISPECIES: XRE family transcriptional regulator [Phytobacter]MDU4152044.1 XRE family transcriptional regulator [Enterobacteriaceae bacterium]PTA96245.1 XRE family transcriptional regulator [Kluyvera sp. Nf5]SLK08226.1 Cupin domain-containing protein [Enterobacter sp. NFR05]MDC0726738.1 XRE family transcriptional regulator [Phytobacter diazotrophicus]MDC0734093.1 XRE family transcriptional regulator [Phytobacter diazotrophicus]
MDLTHYLASTLKNLRQARGWSLSRLADETGVSKAMLGQIERNESSPTVATLWKIATGLNVPFSSFIAPSESETPHSFDPQQQAMVVTPLFPWDEALHFDLFSIILAPGALSESTPHEQGVIEHVVVIGGVLEMCIEGQWRTLTAGSGIRFAGDRPHAYRNSSAQSAHFHSLIHYPKEKTASKLAAKNDDE